MVTGRRASVPPNMPTSTAIRHDPALQAAAIAEPASGFLEKAIADGYGEEDLAALVELLRTRPPANDGRQARG
jgi:hypothetical protein